ncbi:MAG: hypothetical protein F4Y53_01265, partial [Proteobacteria bacterium]|nr:hypothetical protein [Pseudomonadota bacterium]
MSNGKADVVDVDADSSAAALKAAQNRKKAKSMGKSLFNWAAGLASLFVLWWFGGYLIYINPDT